nr:LD-carboxypeptidase [Eubacterium sp.]
MIYPQFLQKGQTIGITAPSDGNRKEMDYARLELAEENIMRFGYQVHETENVRTSDGRGRSSSKEERAEQLMSLFEDSGISYIFSAKGGDFLMEVLPLLDFDVIRSNPKWFQGFSDNTSLVHILTTRCDIATVYGNHFNDFAMQPWHDAVKNNMELMTGNLVTQKTFEGYEDCFYDRENPAEGYRQDKPCEQYAIVKGKRVDEVQMSGRLLGGCIDVLLNLVGTSFDETKRFVEKYKEDGILWYLESFSLDSDSLTRGLWQLKHAGWFEHAKGFVFGRPCFFESFTEHTYQEAVEAVLAELHVPIVFDADIGHKAPQFSVVNGAIGTWTYKNGQSELDLKFME